MNRCLCTTALGVLAACAPATSPPSLTPEQPTARIGETSTGVEVRLGEAGGAVSGTVDAPADSVWAVLPAVYQLLGIRTELDDPKAKALGTRRFTASELGGKRAGDYVRCGYQGAGPSAVSAHRLQLAILTTLQPSSGGGTVLTTEVSGVATPVEGTSTSAVRCVSNGELEQRIRKLVAQRLVR